MRRRELILTAFLAVWLVIGVAAALSTVGYVVLDERSPEFIVSRLGVEAAWIAFILVLLREARGGRLRRATLGGLGLLAVVGLGCAASWTTQLPATILLSALFVVFTATLLEGRAAYGALAAYLAALVAIDIAQFAGFAPESAAWLAEPRQGGESILIVVMLVGLAGAVLLIRSELRTPIGELVSADPEHSPLARSRTSDLTVRETDVTKLVAAGMTDKQIAEELFISPRTVGTHVGNALRKTACANRTELALLAAGEGLVEPGSVGSSSR